MRSADWEPGPTLFNSTIETGIRAVVVLDALYPRACGLAEVICFDHVVVHSGDLGGPDSLHPPLPTRAGELIARRSLVGESVRLMCQMHLIEERHDDDGIRFVASEDAPSFLRLMRTKYGRALKDRARWLASAFGAASEADIEALVAGLIDSWQAEYAPIGEHGREPLP